MVVTKKKQRNFEKLAQADHLLTWSEGFFIDRKANRLSPGTIKFYQEKLGSFLDFCESQLITQVTEITPQTLREYLLALDSKGHNPGGIHAHDEGINADPEYFRGLCKATTNEGKSCLNRPLIGGEYYFFHDHGKGDQAAKAQKLGGQSNRAQHSPRWKTFTQVPMEIRSLEDLLALMNLCKDELLMLSNSVSRDSAIIRLAEAYSKLFLEVNTEERME